MKLITNQDFKSLAILQNEGIFKSTIISDYNKNTPDCYKELASRLKDKCSEDIIIPIFAWQNVIQAELEVNDEQLFRMNEMTSFKESSVLYVLDVPEEYVLLTSFYDFVDARCIEEGIDDIPYFTWKNVYDNLDEVIEVQAIIPYIKKEWTKEIYTIEL